MNGTPTNQTSYLPALAVGIQRNSNELPANMITSNKGPTTTKTLKGFKISHHIEKLKDFEAPLDFAQAIYSPRNPIINFTSPMYRGDELKITLVNALCLQLHSQLLLENILFL